jgi:tetratricopeptide (TPR) repeat protein
MTVRREAQVRKRAALSGEAQARKRAALNIIAFLLWVTPNLFGQEAVGNEKFEQKEYVQAAGAYEKIPSGLRDATILNRLGMSYHLVNKLKPAENAYKAAISKDPRNATFVNNLAAVYYSQGKFGDADKQMQRAVERSPDNMVLRQNLHAAHYAQENTRAAREVVRSVFLKSNPLLVERREGNLLQFEMLMPAKEMNDATLHEARGDSLFARKMYEEAVAEYAKAIAIDRYNASTLNRLGLVYHQMQRFDEAEHYYQEALKQNPYFVEALNNVGTVEYGRKRYDRALAQYKRALTIHPESATIYLNMGACLFDMKRYDEATKATQRALELDPKVLDHAGSGFGTLIQTSRRSDPTVSFYFARLYASRGDKDFAISYLNRALDEGFKEFDKIKTDPSFAALSQEEGFIKIMDRIAELSTSEAER